MNKKTIYFTFVAILFYGYNFTVLSQVKNFIAFPNPATEYFTVNFDLETDSYVKISVYNIFGENIFDIYDDFLEAGVFTKTVNTDDIENLVSGAYILCVLIDDAIIANASIIIITKINIEEIIKNSTVNIFPNPTTSTFTVSFELEKSCYMKIILCDILGSKQLQIYDGFSTVGNFSQTVNTENLAKGIYFLKILIDEKYTVYKIVVG